MDVFRIHPAIGVARVGNSDEFVIAPETMAGSQVEGWQNLTGGLPVKAGSEDEPVRSSDLRDARQALKRHAARFRIFAYPNGKAETWPRGDGAEVTIGANVGGKVVKDIIWTVHVANKKANTFVLKETGIQGLASFADGRLPPIRNPSMTDPHAGQPPVKRRIDVLNDPQRVRQLTIDPGPRTIRGASASPVSFDRPTPASYYDDAKGKVVKLATYPKSFPDDLFTDMLAPSGAIDTLGELLTDANGRLLVLGGRGRAAAWKAGGAAPLGDDVNNNQWFDDTSDGPVAATLVFDDDTRAKVHGAWVTTTDPSFAPQILNVVSLWDDIYDSWVRRLDLAPQIFDETRGGYQKDYKPGFDDQLAPIFKSAALQHWTANLSAKGISAHAALGAITAKDDPATTDLAGIAAIFRDPNAQDQNNRALMPMHLGDGNEAFLTLRRTQFFFLKRWNQGAGHFRPGPSARMGAGEQLDKVTLVNCLGGRFSPGIDMTFIMREPAIYEQPWKTHGGGPFRIRGKPLAYDPASPADKPLLTCGYVPRHADSDGLEPGDLSKFMAIPWHTDYNSCATHLPEPNPKGNRTLFWSWPAQRPIAVYPAADVTWLQTPQRTLTPQLGPQRWSVRGTGTDSALPQNWGRYQDRLDMLDNWQRIGVVMQAEAIDGLGAALPTDGHGQSLPADPVPAQWYLETQSQLADTGVTPVIAFPNFNDDPLEPRQLFYKLMNVERHPEVLPDAKAYVRHWLDWAQALSNNPATAPADTVFFAYTEQAFADRLELIYQELVDDVAHFDPKSPQNPFQTYAGAMARIVQFSPFNMTDGCWLRHIGQPGPMDEVRTLLFSIYMDELGNGDFSLNHCNIYQDLCHSVGFIPAPINSREFAFDSHLLDSAFTVPAFELAVSQFTDDFYPEIMGMTLFLEWGVVDTKSTRDVMKHFGIDPHFFVMHIGIDNAVTGHGHRAAKAIRLHLKTLRRQGGEEAVQAAWRRVWNGYVAFGRMGTLGEDVKAMLAHPPSPRDQMIALIERKADFGSRNHQQRQVGPSRIDMWFNNPAKFLDALLEHDWIRPGDWQNSRMRGLLNFETGPMFRIFTQEDIAIWEAYVTSLGRPAPPLVAPQLSPARAMAALIDELRPVQHGIAGHVTNMLADGHGVVRPLSWWFQQPTPRLMAALASPRNDLVRPGEYGGRLVDLICPEGQMGSVFGMPTEVPNTDLRRDVVRQWILAGCPLLEDRLFALRLNTPASKHERHHNGRILGMGTVH